MFAGVRGGLVVGHIVYGLLLGCFFPLFEQKTKQAILKSWSRNLLNILRVHIRSDGQLEAAAMRGRLLVANHISWLDVIAMNAVTPACYVAKSEVRKWPVLGWMCYRVGTLFIQRGVRRDSLRINRAISEKLKRGECLALFPEGTSTDGVLPGHFHSSLLQGAIESNSNVCPVAIRYHDGTGQANSEAAYIGEMSFVESLWKILCSSSLHVTLYYLPQLSCTGKSRALLASEAQRSIYLILAKFMPE
jgi:1-acyl-sn-glycerol-3-phosphate acyltransferase